MLSPKVRAVYLKELRDAIRDRRTVFASLVVPVVIYPIMLLGVAEVTQLAKARMEKETFPVAVRAGSEEFLENITKDAANVKIEGLPISASALGMADIPQPKLVFQPMTEEDAKKKLADGTVRASLFLPEDFEAQLAANKRVQVVINFDQAEQRSRDANSRLRGIFDNYEKKIIKERLDSQKLNDDFINPIEFKAENVAEASKVGGSIFGSFLPLMFIMMIIAGAITPAIDMTAGEKERSTLETLIGAPIKPVEIITGKFLAVATWALGIAAINVGSFGASIAMMPMPAQMGGMVQFPWAALPLTLLLLLPLALFFAGLLIAVASFAANQKEAQISCLPIYLIPVVGMVVVMTPGIELEGPLLIMPVLNTALLIKELFLSHGTMQQIMFVFFSTCLYAAAMVALAARIFAREEVLFSAQGSMRLFLSRKFFKPAMFPRVGDSLLVVAILFPANFYFQALLAKLMEVGAGFSTLKFTLLVAIPQYGLLLGVPLLAAWYLKLNLRNTFQWRMPGVRGLFSGVLLGGTSWIIVAQLVAWQSRIWPLPENDPLMQSIEQIGSTGWGQALLVFLIGVTPAICEEHLFRGFLQQGVTKAGKWSAILMVGVIFAVYHGQVSKLPVLTLMGMTIAYVAWETRSLLPGIIFHFLHNSLSLIGPSLVPAFPRSKHDLDVPFPLLVPALAIFVAGLLLARRGGEKAEEPGMVGLKPGV